MSDFKRLCDAVVTAQCENNDWVDDPTEAIVRAVLLALREPSEEALAISAVGMLADVTDPWDCMPREFDAAFGLSTDGEEAWEPAEKRIRPNMQRAFADMIDHILITNPQREKALQDLADIDRDLM